MNVLSQTRPRNFNVSVRHKLGQVNNRKWCNPHHIGASVNVFRSPIITLLHREACRQKENENNSLPFGTIERSLTHYTLEQISLFFGRGTANLIILKANTPACSIPRCGTGKLTINVSCRYRSLEVLSDANLDYSVSESCSSRRPEYEVSYPQNVTGRTGI